MSFDAVGFLEGLYGNVPVANGQKTKPSGSASKFSAAQCPAVGSRDPDDMPAETPIVIRVEVHDDEIRLVCPSPEIRDAIEANRGRLEALFEELAATSGTDDWSEDFVDPGDPGPKCGSLEKWWDIAGSEHCQVCEREKLERSERLAALAARLRRYNPPRTCDAE